MLPVRSMVKNPAIRTKKNTRAAITKVWAAVIFVFLAGGFLLPFGALADFLGFAGRASFGSSINLDWERRLSKLSMSISFMLLGSQANFAGSNMFDCAIAELQF